MALGLHHDFAQDEVGWGIEGLQDKVGGGRDGDHFLTHHGHRDRIPKWRINSAKVEQREANAAALILLGEALEHAGDRIFAGHVGGSIAHRCLAKDAG